MPFLTLSNTASNLAEYYNNITTAGVFTGTPAYPNTVGTSKPEIPASEYTTFDDGLIRGGLTNVGLAISRDIIRIGQFITGIKGNTINDFGSFSLKGIDKFNQLAQGTLFFIKQVGLQLTNPKLEQDYSTLNSLTGGTILGGPNRQFTGVGLIESVAGNALGFHFDRGGLLGKIRDNQKYGGGEHNLTAGIVYRNNFGENAKNNFISKNSSNRLVRFLGEITEEKIDISERDSITLQRYFGGPESVYGIGYTNIRTEASERTTIRSSDFGIAEHEELAGYKITSSVSKAELKDTLPKSQLKQLSKLQNKTFKTAAEGFLALSSTDFSTTAAADVKSIKKTIPAIAADESLGKRLNGFIPLSNNVITKAATDDDTNSLQETLNSSPFYNKSTTQTRLVQKPGYNLENRYGVSYGRNDNALSRLDSINVIDVVDSKVFYLDGAGKKANDSLFVADKVITQDISSKLDGDFGKDLVKFRIEFLNKF